MSTYSLISFVVSQIFWFLVAIILVSLVIFIVTRKRFSRGRAAPGTISFVVISVVLMTAYFVPDTIKTFGPAAGPTISVGKIFEFFTRASAMEYVEDIARDPNDVSLTTASTSGSRIKINLVTREVIGEMADGTTFNYWTFDGTVPGPFLRIREGDTVELELKNDPTSIHYHNIDLHAVTGPGGGAVVTNIAPGESKALTFKVLNPGLYVYHCAHPNVATHNAHGMYGLILVEPKVGLPPVDKEFYIMQGEFYSTGDLGKRGLQIFDAEGMLDGKPQYIVFNGRVGGVNGKMTAKTGDRIRIYVGNGGVNLVSSFHVIGEIFDQVYPEGAIGSDVHRNVQTTIVPAGGSTIVEFTVDVPGKYILVDHALSRLDRGAWGTLEVNGEPVPAIYDGEVDIDSNGH